MRQATEACRQSAGLLRYLAVILRATFRALAVVPGFARLARDFAAEDLPRDLAAADLERADLAGFARDLAAAGFARREATPTLARRVGAAPALRTAPALRAG